MSNGANKEALIERDWFGLYGESWQNEITPESFSHPAKFSRALIRRIYQHMIEQGYIRPGDKVADPFGGVALGAIDAMRYGLHWYGMELESKFVDLGNQNIALWNSRYSQWFDTWGTAQLIQGDSRQLAVVLGSADGCVSSPPYANSVNQSEAANDTEARIERMKAAGIDVSNRANVGGKNGVARQDQAYGRSPGQLGAMPEGNHADAIDAIVSSPPFGEGETRNRSEYQDGYVADMMSRAYTQDSQGTTPGNLAAMRADRAGFSAAIGSPPYANGAQHTGGVDPKPERIQGGESHYVDYGKADGQLGSMKEGDFDACLSSPPYANAINGAGEGPGARHDEKYHNGDNAFKQSSQAEYGDTPGQLAAMANGGFEAAVGSPPFEKSLQNSKERSGLTFGNARYGHKDNTTDMIPHSYGDHPANIGNETGDTFWAASRQIIEQVHMVLRPGGYAAWVTKDFIRNKERVEFSNQWQVLCEACGFVPVERIRAWIVEERGTQLGLFGEDVNRDIWRMSFFRRLHTKKFPHLAIKWEDVIIMRKV